MEKSTILRFTYASHFRDFFCHVRTSISHTKMGAFSIIFFSVVFSETSALKGPFLQKMSRSNYPGVFYKKDALKNVIKFTSSEVSF